MRWPHSPSRRAGWTLSKRQGTAGHLTITVSSESSTFELQRLENRTHAVACSELAAALDCSARVGSLVTHAVPRLAPWQVVRWPEVPAADAGFAKNADQVSRKIVVVCRVT